MDVSEIKKAYTVDEITAGMEKTTLNKKKEQKNDDIRGHRYAGRLPRDQKGKRLEEQSS